MENVAFELSRTFVTVCCCNCKMLFAVPDHVQRWWLENGESFCCPAGHSQHYTESTVQKLQKELEREKKLKEWAQQDAKHARNSRDVANRRLTAHKGVVTKLKKRIQAGVCPCCTRTFQNLQRHMQTQHPEYAGADSTPTHSNGMGP